MVEVKYSHRLTCDSHFLHWLSEQSDKETLLKRLMYIKGTSYYWRKQHNLILESESKNCSGNRKINEKYLGGAFKSTIDPNFLSQYKEQIEKNIIFAIDLADEPPFKSYILTSPEIEKEYLKSSHLKDIVSVRPMSGESARKIINNFFQSFISEKEKLSIGMVN